VSVNDAKTTITPLPRCGRGAGGEGSPQHLALTVRQRERAADGGTERWPRNAVVARVRYVPNEKSEFLIMLLEVG